jgi:hypothetical protein
VTLTVYNTPNFQPFGTLVVASNSGGSTSGVFTTSKSIMAESCMVYNSGTSTSFVTFGDGSATASVPTTETQNATPVGGGAIMVLKKIKNYNSVAAINGAGSSTVYFTAGEGQ